MHLPFIRVIYWLETDVFLIFKQALFSLSNRNWSAKWCQSESYWANRWIPGVGCETQVSIRERKRTPGSMGRNLICCVTNHESTWHQDSTAESMGMRACVPLMPSPVTPRTKPSNHVTLLCASLTVIGWPSCKTLCIVINALNVWTSSARIGCLMVKLNQRGKKVWGNKTVYWNIAR